MMHISGTDNSVPGSTRFVRCNS